MYSYVFYLFRPNPGDDPLKAVQAMFPPHLKPHQHSLDPFKHDPDEAPRAPTGLFDPDLDDPETRLESAIEIGDSVRDGLAKMKFELSQVLTGRNPELQYPEAVQIAVQVGAPLEAACRPFRELSLRATATNDVRIDLFDFGARISIPFAIIGDEVRQIFGEVWEYIHLLKRFNDYLAYDPQLGRMIKNTADMILAMTGYEYLYAEQLRAESKTKGLLPEDANELLGDDSTQPLRPDHLESNGMTPGALGTSAVAEAVIARSRPAKDDTGERSVIAGSGAGGEDALRMNAPGASSPRKNWWKFW